MYLTVGDKHLRELESLILRIASPKGNLQQGKFIKSDNLEKQFLKDMKLVQKEEINDMFDYAEQEKPVINKSVSRKGRKPVLAEYIKKRMHLRFRYKGKLYIAHVRTDGTITFAAESFRAKKLQGKVFTSPSLAACAVTKKPMNGWDTWKYERAPGDWVKLDQLRK